MLAESEPGDGTRLDSGGSNGNGDGDGDATKAVASSTSWLHCSVGPKMEEGETDDGLKQQVRSYLETGLRAGQGRWWRARQVLDML